ncbi:MAG TPA: UDP-N-acetylmuramoyl-tripeptide--D-alanyl-D-alanine ligase, partial [Bacteroidales bacterium]|nr:UDP-N-acetylmuramoyl-tripeptide--D-alanyl-D-alanine ligase [Bacteroidales bacterium]
ILVDNCLDELQSLASYHRKILNVPVLAITGTNGKTTTKELIAAVLSKRFKVHYTHGNLNNHIGVPLTILAAPTDTEMMIIEMGASHKGEIRDLCMIAKPGYGIITNIGTAHIEGFGSFEGIVKTKTELYEFLGRENGTALYNDQNKLLEKQILLTGVKSVPFSEPSEKKLEVEIASHELNLRLKVIYDNNTYNICTNLFGRYNVENVRAAVATGLFFGIGIKEIIDAVESYQPSNNRSQVRITKDNTLICDSYNANPTSMHSSLESFASIESDSKMAILGDMLELGVKSEEEHIKILDMIKSLKIDKAFLVGSIFQKVSSEYNFTSFPDADHLKDFLKSEPLKGKVILIKGSRGIGLEKIYDLL